MDFTAEIKKGKYVYYHCTNGKGSCSKNYVREEVIDEQIKAILQSIKLDETRLEWVKEALKLSHKEEKSFQDGELKRYPTPLTVSMLLPTCFNFDLSLFT